MEPDLEFDEDPMQITPQPKKTNALIQTLINTGLVNSEKQAKYVLIAIIVLCLLVISLVVFL